MNNQLNPQQLEACESNEGPLLVLAGAGTGKTRVLTHRIAHIIDNGLAYPSQIMAVTFTNKAASEMLSRTEALVESNGIWIGTFHSLATRIIRCHTDALKISKEFIIIDVDDQWRLLKKIIREKNIDEKIYSPKIIAGIIGRWKDLGLFPENLTSSDTINQAQMKARVIYVEYQQRLHNLNALDFGDLLLFCLKLFKEHPEILNYYQNKFRYIMVDEYQDTNVIQYLWLRFLSQEHKNICAVGDEDQSIYGWRGAEIRNIMKFTHDFSGAKIIRLEQNYRSTKHILETANHLIANNKTRIGKNLWTDIQSEEKVRIISQFNGYKEAESIVKNIRLISQDIPRSEIAILVRASFQTRLIEEALIQSKISYNIIGGLRFYDRLEIKNALAYIRLAYHLDDSLALERIINLPKRGIGSTTITQIQNYSMSNQCSYFVSIKEMLSHEAFRGRTQNTLREFVDLVEGWSKLWISASAKEVCEQILNESGYIASLKLENSLESESRLENLMELLRNIEEFDDVSSFLEHVSLVNDASNDANSNKVKLMTMHAAKGLEFKVVFLPGWEEGVFPSKRSVEESEDGLEEERRLAYVAITRARDCLFISYANSRQVYGEWQNNSPSRFIEEIENLDSVFKVNDLYKENRYSNYDQRLRNNDGNPLKLSVDNSFVSPEDEDAFKVSDRVSHKKFGVGRIISVDSKHSDVYFEGGGYKKIMNSFLSKVNK